MAGAEIIASAIGILCLVIFGYILVGGIITTGEIASSAQKEYVLMKESQIRTIIYIPPSSPQPAFSCVNEALGLIKRCNLTFNNTNTGSESIGNFDHMDIYVNTSEDIRGPFPYSVITPAGSVTYHKFDPSAVGIGGDELDGNWSYIKISPDIIHPNMLDPDEKMEAQINNYRFWITSPAHFSITVVTTNGVTDTYIK